MAKTPDDKPRELAKLVDNEHVTPKSDRTGAHLFKPGSEWKGNALGRPKGSRQKLANDFVQALAEDFDKHGKAAISTVREEDPGKYLDIVSKLVPRDVDVNVNASDSFVKLWELVAAGTFNAMIEDVSRAEERPN